MEEVGLFYEESGMPRMAGRLMGYLLIAVPETQSVNDIAAYLKASKASISTMSRALINLGLVERKAFPGERRDFFRLRTDAWLEFFEKEMQRLVRFRKLIDQGRQLMKDETPADQKRMENIHEMYVWFEKEFPKLIDLWKKEKKIV